MSVKDRFRLGGRVAPITGGMQLIHGIPSRAERVQDMVIACAPPRRVV